MPRDRTPGVVVHRGGVRAVVASAQAYLVQGMGVLDAERPDQHSRHANAPAATCVALGINAQAPSASQSSAATSG
jgi:hypothetical protein